MTRAVAYLRVSTDKQADRGVSLDAQREKVRAYAALYDLDRRRRADALLVAKLDRLTRSVRDLADLLERDFAQARAGRPAPALLSVAEQIDTRSAAGRMVLNILTTVGQWEREAIGERTAAAMAHLRAEGRHTGGDPPFGWRVAGDELLPEPAEQVVLERARALRAAGLSIRAVASLLDEEGHVARGGAEIGPGHVQRWLTMQPRSSRVRSKHRFLGHSDRAAERLKQGAVMKAEVEIVYAAPSQNHNITVELKGSPKGQRLLNAVEGAVEKHMTALAKETPIANNWRRWNLIKVIE